MWHLVFQFDDGLLELRSVVVVLHRREIKMNNNKNLGGMSLNERLFALSLFDEFDHAVKLKDKEQILSILYKCELDEERAQASMEEILNPSVRTSFFRLQSRKLLLMYLFVYPLYYVIAMVVATTILWWFMGWTVEYAIIWFKITASIMAFSSYIIHWRIGLFAFLDSFGK